MSESEGARRARAAELRQRIERLQSGQQDTDDVDEGRMPGESDKEYEERLERRWKNESDEHLHNDPTE
jgi:hypothetical protein